MRKPRLIGFLSRVSLTGHAPIGTSKLICLRTDIVSAGRDHAIHQVTEVAVTVSVTPSLTRVMVNHHICFVRVRHHSMIWIKPAFDLLTAHYQSSKITIQDEYDPPEISLVLFSVGCCSLKFKLREIVSFPRSTFSPSVLTV